MNSLIMATNLKTGERRVFSTQTEASVLLKVNRRCISLVLTGSRKQTAGWKFEYVESRPKQNMEIPSKKLRDILDSYGPTDILSIGSRSGYFFIGDRAELSDFLIENEDILNREVRSQYERFNYDDGYIIIVEGEEIGSFWLREDYQKFLKKKAA